MIRPVIVCIAKQEQDYIEEFVQYHLMLGFKHIFVYDNEDVPTYGDMLKKYSQYVSVIHLPYNNYGRGVQYVALDDFMQRIVRKSNITHVAHIDIDEYIVLKQHRTISEFISEYIKDDCQGIGMNWRMFGSNGHTSKTLVPNVLRFTKCDNGNHHIKTIFAVKHFHSFINCHHVSYTIGNTKNTRGTVIKGSVCDDIDFSVVQLNHYKCKTWPEFQEIRKRGRADLYLQPEEDVKASFDAWNKNEVEDLSAADFYLKYIMGKT